MTGWHVQAMWEADAAAEWERLNAPDPFEDQMKKSAVEIHEAVKAIETALYRLVDAGYELEDTPMMAKVDSFYEELDDIQFSLKMLAEHYGKGERE